MYHPKPQGRAQKSYRDRRAARLAQYSPVNLGWSPIKLSSFKPAPKHLGEQQQQLTRLGWGIKMSQALQ